VALCVRFGVKLLNDRLGIQTRGGCSCAGTYGHYLLNISPAISRAITQQIDAGNLTNKPGWIRLSIHPVMTDAEVQRLLEGIEALAIHHASWARDYRYEPYRNEFAHVSGEPQLADRVEAWLTWQGPTSTQKQPRRSDPSSGLRGCRPPC
jgi:hypothetical protein